MSIRLLFNSLEETVLSAVAEFEGVKLKKGDLTFRFMISDNFSFKIDDGGFEQLVIEELVNDGGVITYCYPEFAILDIDRFGGDLAFFFLKKTREIELNEVLVVSKSSYFRIP